jgi:hypothetical protein
MKWKRFNEIQVSLPSSFIQFAQCPKNSLSEKSITSMLDDDLNQRRKNDNLHHTIMWLVARLRDYNERGGSSVCVGCNFLG